MPYPTTNTNPSEIKLFYQVYNEKNSKPHDAILFNSDFSQKFEGDVVDDLVDKGLWDETLEHQLENKQLYFKVFRDDEDMIPADAIMLENVRILPNQGLPSLEKSLQNTWNSSLSWLGSFVPERVKQSAYDFGNSVARWTEDKLTGLSAYSSIPKVEEMDEEEWHEIVAENSDHLFPNPSPCRGRESDPTKDKTDFSSKSFVESLFNTVWGFTSYAYNNPLKTFTLALATYSVANNIRLPKINFENHQTQFANGISTATNILAKLTVAKIATNEMHVSAPLKTMIAGMSFWNPVTATTPEFLVNTYTTIGQTDSSVVTLADSSFVVTWVSNGEDGSGHGIYGQLFNTVGLKLGFEFQVNTYTTNTQASPSVASFADGSFVVTWYSYQQDGSENGVYGQRFNRTGGALGSEFQINNYTTSSQTSSSVTSLPDGGFVVTWMSYEQDASNYGVYAQRFTSSAVKAGAEFLVNTYTTDEQSFPSVASSVNNSFMVTWHSNLQDGSQLGVYAMSFNATSGASLGTEFLVNTYTTNDQWNPSVTSLLDGNFVVVWMSSGQDGSSYGIYGQRFNAIGTKLGTEFLVNTYTTNNQQYPAVASFADGSFVVTWMSNLQDGSGQGIYAQRFSTTGTKLGTEFQVNTYTTNDQSSPSVATFLNGSFVVTWVSNLQDGSSYGIYGRLFTPPHLINNTLTLNEGQTQIITNTVLSASAPNTPASGLNLILSNVTYGRFELASTPGIPIFNFTLQYVNSGLIQFAHDGSEFAPSYTVRVKEILLDTTPSPAKIIFTNVNDRPILIGSGGSFIFTEKSVPLIIDPNVTVSDADNLYAVNATVAITINFAGSEDILTFVDQSGITGSYNNTTGQLFLTGSSAISNYQLALRNVTYFNPALNPSSLPRTISFVVNDGSLNSNTITRIINVTSINDIPVLVGSGGSISFTEKDSPLIVDPNITLTDVDSLNMTSGTVSISNFAGTEDILGFINQPGISANYNTGSGLLSLIGSSSLANYQAFLRSVTYRDTSNNPSLLPRTIAFTVNDSGVITNTTRIINIIPINDAPTLAGSGGTLSFTEKNPATVIDSGIIVFDVDSPNLSNATVKFTSSVLAEDLLSFTTQGGISGTYSNSTGILFLTGPASVANYQSVLRSVTYFNPSFNPSAALRTVSFEINDGELNSNTITRSISVTPVNDPPVLTVNTLSITGGQALNLTSSQLYAADPDTSDSSLVFTMSAIQFCRFERTTAAEISIITFTQQDTLNNQIRIVPTGGIISAPAYQASVSDGQYSTSPASASVNFNGGFVPSISVNKLTITQGGVVTLTTNQLNAFDADTPASSLTFTVSNIRYGTFSIVSNPADPITSFTLQSILNGFIQFRHDGSENVPSYDISVSDGLQSTNPKAAVITYININQAPIVLNIIPDRLNEKVDQAFLFQVAANTFFDSDPGDQSALVYSARMQNGNVLPAWISFDSSNRQFTGKPVASGKTQLSVIAKDPSNAIGIANFTIDVIAALSQTTHLVSPAEDNTVRNALIGAGVSALIGFMAFALKYGIRKTVNKKLQDALDAKQSDTEKKQREYDNEVIKPIANYINEHLKVTAPFESISTEKVKNFVSAVRVLVSEMGLLGLQYQKLDEANQNIVQITIVKELKRITTPTDENCCSALLRCGFFKADVTSQQIEENAETIAKAVNKALNRSQFNAVVRNSDPKDPRGLVAQSVELTPIPESTDSTPSKPEAPRNSAILPKLEAERAARQQLEGEMAEMKKQMAFLLSAQSGAPVTISQSQPASTPSLSM
jgi:hypothetical protein